MGIKHTDVKTSHSVGLATEWNKDHKIDGNVDMDQFSLTDNVIENRTSFPAGPIEGQIIWRSDLNEGYIFDGTNWKSLGARTQYWTCTGTNFHALLPTADTTSYDTNSGKISTTDLTGDTYVQANVNLQDKAVITKVIVYSNSNLEDWEMRRIKLSDASSSQMATAGQNTEDTTITNATIDNINYAYIINASGSAATKIYGVRITYTL